MDESRRDLIKKAAVGTGIVWAAPVLRTGAAYAAGTPQPTTSSTPTTIPGCTIVGAALDGTQEVPPVATFGTGTAAITFDEGSLQLCITFISFSGLTGTSTAAHIHGPAPAGANAAILFPLTIPLGVQSGNTFNPECFTLTAAQRDQLCAGLFYVNIHSTVYPGGEIRGQIEPI